MMRKLSQSIGQKATSKLLGSSNNLFFQARSIVSVKQLEGIPIFKSNAKHLSPVMGAVMQALKTPEGMYLDNQLNLEGLHTHKLAGSIFNYLDDEIRATHNKSLPAYSLTPDLLAKIIFNLDSNSLEKATVDITKEWKAIHLSKTGSKLSTKKISTLLNTVAESKKENTDVSSTAKYIDKMTEYMLLSFLLMKSNSIEDVMLYVNTLNSLKPVKSSTDKLVLHEVGIDDVYDKLNLLANGKTETTVKVLEREYENILFNFLLNKKILPKVSKQGYAVGRGEKRPSCVETCYHNICNIIFYNSKTKSFDLSLLPKSIKINPELESFYQKQNYSIDNVVSYKVGQDFFNIVSGVENVDYWEYIYEIVAESTPKNFITIMNHLFGTNAKTYQELSAKLSDEKRQIDFSKQDGLIQMIIKSPGVQEIKIAMAYMKKHSFIYGRNVFIPGSKFMFDKIPESVINNLWEKYDTFDPMFFPALNNFTSNRLMMGGDHSQRDKLIISGERVTFN